ALVINVQRIVANVMVSKGILRINHTCFGDIVLRTGRLLIECNRSSGVGLTYYTIIIFVIRIHISCQENIQVIVLYPDTFTSWQAKTRVYRYLHIRRIPLVREIITIQRGNRRFAILQCSQPVRTIDTLNVFGTDRLSIDAPRSTDFDKCIFGELLGNDIDIRTCDVRCNMWVERLIDPNTLNNIGTKEIQRNILVQGIL